MTAKTYTNITNFISDFLADLSDRQKEVLRRRYGLDGSEPQTLQAIGNRYSITRERVRQIEAAALAVLRKKTEPYLKSFVQTAVSRLKTFGGVHEEEAFLHKLNEVFGDRSPKAVFMNAARFLFDLSGKVFVHRDQYDKHWHPFFYLSDLDKKRAKAYVGKVVETLEDQKDLILREKKFDAVLAAAARTVKVNEGTGSAYLGISKQFVKSPFNQLGLAGWPEINPRTARDWAYLVLKKEQKPLHFSEISKLISGHRKNKRTNLQTVHNELIKDDRFVLVGRGTYGLREFGYLPGTAKEIIAHILKKHGPLRSREVINLVKKQRLIKDGTILINLQNRKHFNCLDDGRYCLREA